MGFKIVHTSDWHLGQRLDRLDRKEEHQAFLEWLLSVLEEEKPDLLAVCGDVFDSANPPVESVGMLYTFLARASAWVPNIVVIGGNHDSGMRLDVVSPLLKGTGITVLGACPGEAERCVVPVMRDGIRVAVVAAVPYLRPYDLATALSGETEAERAGRIVDSVTARFREIQDAADGLRCEGEALIVLGHLFVAGGLATPESERPVQVEAGRIMGVPAEALGNRAACILLGHLHRPQRVKGPVPVLYSGSPIPLTFDEARYPGGVTVVEVAGRDQPVQVRRLPAPKVLELAEVTGTLDECRAKLTELAKMTGTLDECRAKLTELAGGPPGSAHGLSEDGQATTGAQEPPREAEAAGRGCRGLVKVTVRLDGPVPGLREELAALLDGSGWVLAVVRRESMAGTTGETVEPGLLDDLPPDEVFRRRYARLYPGSEVPSDLVDAFHELLEEVWGREGEP